MHAELIVLDKEAAICSFIVCVPCSLVMPEALGLIALSLSIVIFESCGSVVSIAFFSDYT